jgi:hypothetical protein
MNKDSKFSFVFTSKTVGRQRVTLVKIRRAGADAIIESGMAVQNPKDNDDKVLGQKFAIRHAISKSKLPKSVKTNIWQEFFDLNRKTRKKFNGIRSSSETEATAG